MDLETVFLVSGLIAAWAGSVAAIMHMIGYIPPRYRTQLAAIQSTTASAIGQELRAVFSEQEAKLAVLAKEQEEAFNAQARSAEMSVVRAVGVDKQAQAKVGRLLGEAILGPAMPLLRQFAPGLADALEENPQLIDVVVQNPLFRKYVAPRIEQYLGAMGGQNPEPAGGGGWGT